MSLNTDLDPDRTATEEGRQAMRLAGDLHKERQRVKELEAALRDVYSAVKDGDWQSGRNAINRVINMGR